jgi:adenylate kinase
MIIILLGPPASGKGTQGEMLAEKKGLIYISTGQMLRDLAERKPEFKTVLNKGLLFPDGIVILALEELLEEKGTFDQLIIDGTPRSVGQYELLKDFFAKKGTEITDAVFIDISKDEAVKRITSRRQDKTTGKVYNLLTNPPGPEVDPLNLILREDDSEEVMKKRFDEYQKDTEPLVDHLEKEGILIKINGERPIDLILEEIVEKLK